MSAPAAKARSEPVTIMQRTSVPRSQLSSASANSLSKAVLRALSASGRLSVGMRAEPVNSVLIFMLASALALGTIESGAARLHDAFDGALATQLTGLAFAAIDQEVMLEIAGIAGGLGMIAQGRAAGGDGVLEHFLDGCHQRRQ